MANEENEFNKVIQSLKNNLKRKIITNANILEVGLATNTPKYGDAGHGGRTYIKISNLGSTSWAIRVKENDNDIIIEDPSSIEILLRGDSEAYTFAECMKFIAICLNAFEEEKEILDLMTYIVKNILNANLHNKDLVEHYTFALWNLIDILKIKLSSKK